MIGIRWSTDEDCDRLAALHREAWRNAYAGIIPGVALERMIARRGGRGPSGEIYEIYLRPECQGVGFGRRLFRAARDRLGAAGLRRLLVWALADNAAACRF